MITIAGVVRFFLRVRDVGALAKVTAAVGVGRAAQVFTLSRLDAVLFGFVPFIRFSPAVAAALVRVGDGAIFFNQNVLAGPVRASRAFMTGQSLCAVWRERNTHCTRTHTNG